jgi:hypothetical protein
LSNQPVYLLPISFNVLPEFFLPLLSILFRVCCISAFLMPVPEAPMHKYDKPVFGQDNIGPPWQLAVM